MSFDISDYEECKPPRQFRKLKIIPVVLTIRPLASKKRPAHRRWCWLSLQLDALLERLGINVGMG